MSEAPVLPVRTLKYEAAAENHATMRSQGESVNLLCGSPAAGLQRNIIRGAAAGEVQVATMKTTRQILTQTNSSDSSPGAAAGSKDGAKKTTMTRHKPAARNITTTTKRSVTDSVRPGFPIVADFAPEIASNSAADLTRLTERLLLRGAPAAVLINRRCEILNYHGPTRQYLENPAGPLADDLLCLALDGLRTKLRAAVLQAVRGQQTVVVDDARVIRGGSYYPVKFTVERVREVRAEGLLLVTFEEREPTPSRRGDTSEQPGGQNAHKSGCELSDESAVIRLLEFELKVTRDDLQATIEEQESANEELKAANEEVMSMNEEFQSTNEELESAKEELQALNEELATVNSQLENKVEELETANSLVTNLLRSMKYATVFLDRDFQIKLFTSPAEQLFSLRPTDVGRPISEISPKITDPDLRVDCRTVLNTLVNVEREVWTVCGAGLQPANKSKQTVDFKSAFPEAPRCYLRRVLPFRTADNRIDGVVMTLMDITDRKRAEQVTHEARLYAEGIIDTVREPLVVLDTSLRVQSANSAFYEFFEVAPDETENRLLYELGNRQWDIPELRTLLEEMLPHNSQVTDFFVDRDFDRIGRCTMLLNARRIRRGDDRPDEILLAIEDVTERQQAEDALRKLHEQLEQRVADQTSEIHLLAEAISHLGEGILITDDDLDWPGRRIRFVNAAMCRISGYSAEELIGQSPSILQCDAMSEAIRAQMRGELAGNRSCSVELVNYRKDGTPYKADLFITPLFDAAGNRTNFVSIHRDITERRQAEQALQQREDRFRKIFEHAATGIAITDWNGCFQQCNPAYCQMLGYSQDELRELRFDLLVHPDDREANLAELQRLQAEQLPFFEIENRYIRKNGQPIRVRKFVSILRDEAGKPAQLVALVTDVTDRRRQEQLLREREERLQAILSTASDTIINIDRRGIITDVNPATEQMFGYTQEELISQNVKILMPPPYRDEHDGYITRYLETGEVVGRHKNGSISPVELAVSTVDHLGLFTGIIRDVSERKKLQRDILAIAEGEQHRIGQDLHDSTQQELVGLGMLAQTLVDNLLKESAERSKAGTSDSCQLAKRILDGITRAHQEVQTISRGLVPMRLVNEGLMDALRELASRTDDREGITCAFKCEQPVEIPESVTATHLYRIAQEAITNALKHARPEHILISLESHSGHPILQVADDGTGFVLSEPSEGIGLKTMVYRASLIGANLTITPVETGGTLVTCKVFGARG
jgi:PAS domain S-box-containing protein